MKYGLIGEHLGHSFSPQIHALLGNGDYRLEEISQPDLASFLATRDFLGINVTIPYKKAVMPYLDFIDDEAAATGAVNTIVNRNGKLYGYNTDCYGFKALVSHSGIDIKDSNVLILGAGGAAAAVEKAITDSGAKSFKNAVRRPAGKQLLLSKEAFNENYLPFEVIINATPVGMFPEIDGVPVDIEAFPKIKGVIDCIYNPVRTELISEALKKGIPAEGGLYMLVAQACRAHELFFDTKVPSEKETGIYTSILHSMENIVLTGMPSCGKSTIGRIIAEKTGRKFIDTDRLIVDRTGLAIEEIFNRYGEKYFRTIESEIIREVAAEHSAVISTGGGTILNPENIRQLKKNGKVFFIDRGLELLTTGGGRPLSKDRDAVRELFIKREPLYRSLSDITVRNNSSIEECVNEICKY